METFDKKKRVLISGASGLIGNAFKTRLTGLGHDITVLKRGTGDREPGVMRWNAQNFTIQEPQRLADFDLIVHLAGEPVVGRWRPSKKQRIYTSRIQSANALIAELIKLEGHRPDLIIASAIGFYGDRGDEILTEESKGGWGFLPHVCMAWESVADRARDVGIRVIHTRFGMVLSPEGGALKAMLPPFRLGVGGRIGPGTQYVSWIALEDVVGALEHIMNHPDIHGPINVVGPAPCTQLEFTKALGTALRRPTLFPVPAFALHLLFGRQMADELLLYSQRVHPDQLTKSGYAFKYPTLDALLAHFFHPDRNK